MDGSHISEWVFGVLMAAFSAILSVLGFFLRKMHGDIADNTKAITAVN
jgi:hypothetical protein